VAVLLGFVEFAPGADPTPRAEREVGRHVLSRSRVPFGFERAFAGPTDPVEQLQRIGGLERVIRLDPAGPQRERVGAG
jgi:hypothetical protein